MHDDQMPYSKYVPSHTFIYRACIGMFILFILFLPEQVRAQIMLEQSDPAPEAVVETVPAHIHVTFSNPVHTEISYIALKDEDGQEIISGRDIISGMEANELALQIPALHAGRYDVHWRVMGLDAQITEGVFGFIVAETEESEASESVKTQEKNESQPATSFYDGNWLASESGKVGNSGWIGLLQIVELLLVFGAIGWMVFRMYIWSAEGDRLTKVEVDGESTKRSATNRQASIRIRRNEGKCLCVVALLLLGTGSLHIFHLTTVMTDTMWDDPLFWQTAWMIASSTLLGLAVGIRVIGMLLLAALSVRQVRSNMWPFFLFLLMILPFSIISHSYNGQMIVPHMIHMFALVFWLAGLIGFSVYAFRIDMRWEALQYMHERLKRFSLVALVVLYIVIISGILLAVVFVQEWQYLDSDYGHTLLLKLALFAPVLLIAAWHRWVWWPAMRRAQSEKEQRTVIRTFVWGLRAELVLATAVIITAGMLSQQTPPGNPHEGHDHAGANIQFSAHPLDSRQEMLFRAFVFNDHQRLSAANVTFEIWDEAHAHLINDLENYCQDNNMRLDLFRDVLIERGVVHETMAEENDDRIYVGRYVLEPGIWNIGVRVEHGDEDIYVYDEFTIQIE